jgi:hypothetical protein
MVHNSVKPSTEVLKKYLEAVVTVWDRATPSLFTLHIYLIGD